MVAGLDPHSQYFDKKTFKEFKPKDGAPWSTVDMLENQVSKLESTNDNLQEKVRFYANLAQDRQDELDKRVKPTGPLNIVLTPRHSRSASSFGDAPAASAPSPKAAPMRSRGPKGDL